MGTVYRATQLSLERVVALKVLTAELSSDPAFRERFRREGLLQAALDHPHIVTVYEAGETDNRLFLAMRMVEGPTLKELIERRELDDSRALRLLTQVAEALDAAHEKGLIHRDVKPQNVLVGAGDHAYLADFGLTKGSDDAAMTETGQFVGTIDYISPEQARGETGHGAQRRVRADGRAVRVPHRPGSVCEGHRRQGPARAPHRARTASVEVRSDLPAAMDEVVAEGMAKDPEDAPGVGRRADVEGAASARRRVRGRSAPPASADTTRSRRRRRDPDTRRRAQPRRAMPARPASPPPCRRRAGTAPAGDGGPRRIAEAGRAPRRGPARGGRGRSQRLHRRRARAICAGAARRRGACGRRRTPARRRLGRLRRTRSATRRRRAMSNSPSRPAGSGSRAHPRFRGSRSHSRSRLRRASRQRRALLSAWWPARSAPRDLPCCPPRSRPP